MQENIKGQVTCDLESWINGNQAAGLRVFENTYTSLVSIAGAHRNRVGNITITPNEVVHDAYTRLVDAAKNSKPRNSLEFYRLAAHVFRLTCIDYLRVKLAKKRNLKNVVNEFPTFFEDDKNLLNIFILLDEFEGKHQKQAIAFELNKIIGFSLGETAELTSTSKATVSRDIKFARHWLAARLID